MKSSTRRSACERRVQLAQEALRILADGGTRMLTAKRLGESAGISDAAVFKHYPSMEAVVDAAIAEFESLLAVPSETNPDDPFELLRRFVIGRIEQIRRRPELLGLVFSKNLENAAGEDGAKRVRQVAASSTLHVKRCLDQAQREGTVGEGVSTTILTWMLQGVIQAAARQSIRQLSADEIWNQVAQILTSRAETKRQGKS